MLLRQVMPVPRGRVSLNATRLRQRLASFSLLATRAPNVAKTLQTRMYLLARGRAESASPTTDDDQGDQAKPGQQGA